MIVHSRSTRQVWPGEKRFRDAGEETHIIMYLAHDLCTREQESMYGRNLMSPGAYGKDSVFFGERGGFRGEFVGK
jgi:hypothetical protein